MKLIIDIPVEVYRDILKRSTEIQAEGYVIAGAVLNAIPLDDLKAEMEKHQFSREYCCDHNIDTAIDMSMVRIILDSIGKESGEKWTTK